VGDLIRDSLLLAVRRPLPVVVLPVLVMVGSAWFLGFGKLLTHPSDQPWVRPDTVAAMPLLGLVWVAIAWERSKQAVSVGEKARRVVAGALAGGVLALAFLFATEHTYVGGVVLIGLFAPLVPVAACESGWIGRSVRRSFALVGGSHWRIVLAWGLLELVLLLMGLGLAFAAVVFSEGTFEHSRAFGVAHRVHAGLRWGLTMAICVVAYRRLKVSRAALDVDAWVEVFR
jgi:hypothetical protein